MAIMNKYIKKCIIIYTSLALILMGMAGVTYAITATDADQYVTRSQYALDMSYLQTMLEEEESNLMGNINKFRTTDIKFVTFDTPDKQYRTNDVWDGYHNGGNMWPRPHTSSIGTTGYWSYNSLGWASSMLSTSGGRQDGMYSYISMYRLWNGNYYVTNDLGYSNTTNPSYSGDKFVWYTFVHCAVPVENFPGWYLVLSAYRQYTNYITWQGAFVKLDPNVPYPNAAGVTAMDAAEKVIRLKKDLWKYVRQNLDPIPTTPYVHTFNLQRYDYSSYLADSNYSGYSLVSTGITSTLKSWIDPETGDYMTSYANFPVTCAQNGNRSHSYYLIPNSGDALGKLMPSDNVEYLMGPTVLSTSTTVANSTSAYYYDKPDPYFIGTGTAGDAVFEYEIVDCINGIKYWHAKKKGHLARPAGGGCTPDVYTVHYSLPIVY